MSPSEDKPPPTRPTPERMDMSELLAMQRRQLEALQRLIDQLKARDRLERGEDGFDG